VEAIINSFVVASVSFGIDLIDDLKSNVVDIESITAAFSLEYHISDMEFRQLFAVDRPI